MTPNMPWISLGKFARGGSWCIGHSPGTGTGSHHSKGIGIASGRRKCVCRGICRCSGELLGLAPQCALDAHCRPVEYFHGTLHGSLTLADLRDVPGLLNHRGIRSCFEFIFYFEFVDPLLKKKRSVNVIGTLRKPGTENVKRLLILSGHHDSALENTWLRFLGVMKRRIKLNGLTDDPQENNRLLLRILYRPSHSDPVYRTHRHVDDEHHPGDGCDHWRCRHRSHRNTGMGPAGLSDSAFYYLCDVLYQGRENGGTVPGAADNLSASALAVAMCRFLVKNPSYIPDDTEIRFISFGSEEAGLRGSRRYVERHLDELKRLDARLLNFESSRLIRKSPSSPRM